MLKTIKSLPRQCMFTNALALCLAMVAQSGAAQQSQAGAPPVQSVVITGSSIPRQDAEAPSPVQVISADELKKSGYTSIAQVLENLTATGAGTLNQGFTGAFAAGASGIALRGLSVAATLVLIDGHRMAPNALSDDGQRSFVDVGNIPFDTIERVEILKDGASAIYGSDAMAGVVNIILKKSFVGTTANAEAGKATEGGGTTEHFSVTHGIGTFSDDGYNAYASLEYRHQDPVAYGQRVGDGLWANQNWSTLGGNNAQPFATETYLQGVNSNAIEPLAGPCTAAQISAGNCTTQTKGNLIPKTENLNFLASFTKNLGEDWKINAKASVFNSKDDIAPLGNGQTFSSIGPIIAAGPYNAGGVSASPTMIVPANYPGNTLGQPAYALGVIPGAGTNAAIAPASNTQSNTIRLVAELNGSIGDWDVDAAIGYTKNIIHLQNTAMLNVNALYAALNRPASPFLLNGNNTAADLATIFPSNSQTDSATLEFAEFHATRSLLDLEGGALGMSTGAQFIYRKVDAPDSLAAQSGSANGAWYAYTIGSQSDTAAYIEMAAPVLKTLEVDGAVRYDHFDGGIGGSTTPKLGFKWTPGKQFALRGTLAAGFRAPNPSENGNSGLVYSDSTLPDPILCPGGITTTPGAVLKYCTGNPFYVHETSNPNLQPEKSRSGTLGVILEPVQGWGSTIDLYEIKIDNQIVPGAISALPNYAPAEPAICTGPTGTGEVPCGPGTGYTGLNTGTPGLYFEPYVNANSTQTSGLELSTSYRFRLGQYGDWTPKLDWSHMMSYVQTIGGTQFQLAGTHGPSAVNADSGNPKDRIQASITFDKGPWSITTTFNWVSGYGLTDPTPSGYNAATCQEAQAVSYIVWFPGGASPTNFCRVGSFLDTDLTVFYKISKQFNLHLAITNVLNRQAPVDLATYGGVGLPYSPTLHEAGIMGRFANVGLTYHF